MAEITIGDVSFISDGKTLTISRHKQSDRSVTLDRTGVEELIDFLASLAETEFNRRQTFRVPLWDSSGLYAQIRTEETELQVTPTNVSLTGIFVQPRGDDWLDLELGDNVEVNLDFEGQALSYLGVVRRCENNGFGLFFPVTMNAEEIDPPPELTRIVMELQRRWMARHRKRTR